MSTQENHHDHPSLADNGPLHPMPLHSPGEYIPGEDRPAFHSALLRLMASIHALYANQTNPRGSPANPTSTLSRHDRRPRWAGSHARIPRLRTARLLCAEWFCSDNPRERDELTCRVAEVFIQQQPDTSYVFDGGFLCDEAALQRMYPDPRGSATAVGC